MPVPKLFIETLERKGMTETRQIASIVDKSRYGVEKSLKNLSALGLVESELSMKGPMEVNSWRPTKEVLGLMRLIPAEYFKKPQLQYKTQN